MKHRPLALAILLPLIVQADLKQDVGQLPAPLKNYANERLTNGDTDGARAFVTAFQKSQGEAWADHARADAEIQKILASDEFKPREKGFLERLSEQIGEIWRRLIEWLASLFPGGGQSPIAQAIVIAIAAVALAIGVAMAIRFLPKPRKRVLQEAAVPIDSISEAADWRAEAARLAQKGQYREACRALYLAAAVALGERGLLVQDDAKTNWERLRAARSDGREDVYRLLTPATHRFDAIWYGRFPADEAEYAKFERILAEIPALQATR